MKRKMAVLVMTGLTMAMLLTGCQAKPLSNEYVTVEEYKGVKVDKVEHVKVTDKDVETQISKILDQYASTKEVDDRAAKLGDIANIDYVGKKDDVAFEGGTAQGFNLELGSHRFIDGFEDGIVGHKVGETFELKLKFPEQYHSADLAGQDVIFTVTLNSLTEKKVPELTDEFVAKNFSDVADNVKEYKEELKEKLTEQNEKIYEENLRNTTWEAVLAKAEVKEYPKEEVEKYETMLREQYEAMAEMYQVEFSEFLKLQLGMDEETFAKQVKQVAEKQVKSELVRDLLAKNIDADQSKEEYQERYETFAKESGFDDVDAFLKQMEDNGKKEALDGLVLLQIVQDWVADNCKQV